MGATMQCVRFMGGEKVELVERPIPCPADDEALVRVAVSAICGSELPAYRDGMGDSERSNPGHELAGVVEKAGPRCDLAPGQPVGVQVMSGCGQCRHCATGEYEHCVAGAQVLGDAHCEYLVVPRVGLVPLPDDLDWESAVLLCGDTLGTPYRAIRRLGGVNGGDVAAVFGCGPIGLGSVAWLDCFGARVIVSEPRPFRRELAIRMGADLALDPLEEDVGARIRAETDGGADVCLDCSHSGATLTAALESARVHGRVGLVGEKPEATIKPSAQLIRKELTVVASWYFTVGEFFEELRHSRRGFSPRGLVTHRFRLDEAADAYAIFAAGEAGKVVFRHRWSDGERDPAPGKATDVQSAPS